MSQKYLREYVNAGSLKSLSAVLWEWINLNRKLCREWDWSDCPWWYTERASVSLFAGAVWKSKGIALEAYSNKKGKGSGSYPGRCDLYFKIGNQEFIAEAKQCWSNAGERAHPIAGIIESKQEVAFKDVKKIQGEGERKIGIVFVVPKIHKSYGSQLPDRLTHWQNQLLSLSYTSIAWVFPFGRREPLVHKNNIFPGAAVLIQEVE